MWRIPRPRRGWTLLELDLPFESIAGSEVVDEVQPYRPLFPLGAPDRDRHHKDQEENGHGHQPSARTGE